MSIEITSEPPPPPRKGGRMVGGAQIHLVRETDNEVVNVVETPYWWRNDAALRDEAGIQEIRTRAEKELG